MAAPSVTRLLIRTGVVVASGLLALAAIEGLLRLTLSTPREPLWQAGASYRVDPELIYSLAPGTGGSWSSDEFTERRSINRLGLRGREIEAARSDDTRIVVLGDSTVFGHGVGDAEAFPVQLEEVLRRLGHRVEVLNAGVPGYGTDQAYQLFALRLRRLDPDLVVFGVYLNDPDDNIRQSLFTIDGDSLIPVDGRTSSLYLAGRLSKSTPGPIRRTRLYGLLEAAIVGHDRFHVLPSDRYDDLIDWSRRKISLEIAALQDMGRTDGFKILVLGMPHPGLPGYDWWNEIDQVAEWSVDASRQTMWHDQNGLFFRDSHLTPRGNRLLAEAVSASILEKLGPQRLP